MDNEKKRPSEQSQGGSAMKKAKKQWQTPKKNFSTAPSINPGDAGVWATCDMHKEGLCTVELKDLFDQYAQLLYGEDGAANGAVTDLTHHDATDIEADIQQEVQGMQNTTSKQQALFTPVKIDVQCVLFFKTRHPVEPVSFVHRICEDASNDKSLKRTRFVKRLTPMTRMGKANEKSLEEVSKLVLGPFAIRPTIRNHQAMKRDNIIKRVADLVGKPHTVDLTHYNRLILVDVYRNILGMSIVDGDYEKFKRYNLAEIYEPTPQKSEA
ncbi:MAG: hypothetical protein LQ344_002404 [Seirophora lacunosa]|nr:MAG: hypothetical protein LQ344_002404 [Seirophora lacunosa]